MRLLRPLALSVSLALGGCVSTWFPAPPASTVGGAAPAPPVALAPGDARADPRPVVLTGADLGPLRGIDPADLAAVSVQGGRYVEVPVQVDERFVYDLAVVYRGMAPGDCPRTAWCRDLDGHVVRLGYADPDTHVGADPDPTLDRLDEVALLAADFGDEPPGAPPGLDPASAVQVRIVGGGAGPERVVTLGRRTAPGTAPPAPRVAYRAAFERGPYLATYDRAGVRPPWAGWPAGVPSGGRGGSNPEASWVQTPHYALAFSDRWVWDRLHVGPPGARGPDLLDVDMVMFGPGICERTPRTGSLSEGGFLVNRSGPVRAIRHAVGFNSGPLVEGLWTFYPRLAESRTALRVHKIPGVMAFLDLSDAARGAVYRDAAHPDGVTVDGRPDRLPSAPPTWQAVERGGPQTAGAPAAGAGWVVAHTVEAFDPGGRPAAIPAETFYRDDDRPATAACMTDRAYLGAHGVRVRGPIPTTDPRDGPAGRVALVRRFVFGGDRAADLGALAAPLRVRTRWEGGGAAVAE